MTSTTTFPWSTILTCALLSTLISCSYQAEPARGDAQTAQVYTRTLPLPGYDAPVTVHYAAEHGLAVTEGDIVLGSAAELTELGTQANVRQSRLYRWPGGVVPYRIDASVSPEGRANIFEATQQWERQTAFRFVPYTGQPDYVTFTRGAAERTCFSSVGRQGGEQFVYLTASGTCSKRTLVHELGHTVGLWHEHSRADRDAWIAVNYANVSEGEAYDFAKLDAAAEQTGLYDYCSVMHYNTYAFSKNRLPTLQLLKPVHCAQKVGSADVLSRGDVAAAARLSSCGCSSPLEGYKDIVYKLMALLRR